MVKLSGFTSVNPNEQQTEGLSPTLEAEEAAVIDLYEQGIQAALDGHEQEAEVCCFENEEHFYPEIFHGIFGL